MKNVYVLYDAKSEPKLIKMGDDGCLAIFEDEKSAIKAKRLSPNTEYSCESYTNDKKLTKINADAIREAAAAVAYGMKNYDGSDVDVVLLDELIDYADILELEQ